MATEKAETDRVPVTLALSTITYLEKLERQGTHGTSVPGVAKTLIEEGIRLAIKDGLLAIRHRLGLAFNEMVASGEVKAPIVIGRDQLLSGSVASPNRETEAMRDGSDAVSDWPLLNALLNCASGPTWVSLHHGGGVGMGFSQHAGMVVVADGTPAAAARLARVLWNDPASGVMRHADAGYEEAIECARAHQLDLPGILG